MVSNFANTNVISISNLSTAYTDVISISIFQVFVSYLILILVVCLNSSVWLIVGAITGTTTPGQGRPESNGNEEVHCFSQTLRLEPHYHILFNIISYFW